MTKPEHLSKAHGDQFADESIVANYHHRPAYTEAVLNFLSGCRGKSHLRVLDLGCGTGEVAIPLSLRGHSVVGVDPSAEMIKLARSKGTQVEFIHSYIEAFSYPSGFDLIVAANSIHWADWPAAFSVLASVAKPDAKLAVVTGGDLRVPPIAESVLELVKEYSTTKDFKPYCVVDMLREQGYLFNTTTERFANSPLSQKIEHYIASFHARNGFSAERMGLANAANFDHKMAQLLSVEGFVASVEGSVTYAVTLADIAPSSVSPPVDRIKYNSS